MKKIFSNNRLIAFAFLTLISSGFSSPLSAAGQNPFVPVELKFAGLVKDNPLFELSFTGNAGQNNFTVIISDDYGHSIYKETFRGENFSKKFLLNADEIGEENLQFKIYCNNTKSSVTYNVNRNTRTVQDIAITKVK